MLNYIIFVYSVYVLYIGMYNVYIMYTSVIGRFIIFLCEKINL